MSLPEQQQQQRRQAGRQAGSNNITYHKPVLHIHLDLLENKIREQSESERARRNFSTIPLARRAAAAVSMISRRERGIRGNRNEKNGKHNIEKLHLFLVFFFAHLCCVLSLASSVLQLAHSRSYLCCVCVFVYSLYKQCVPWTLLNTRVHFLSRFPLCTNMHVSVCSTHSAKTEMK
jgi:hypothetical protein